MRGLAAVLIASFVVAGSAETQCGWILWDKSTTPVQGQPTGTVDVRWEPLDGYVDAKECRSAGESKLKEMAEFMRANKLFVSAEPNSRYGIFGGLKKDEPGHTQEYLCFPVGFDPRR